MTHILEVGVRMKSKVKKIADKLSPDTIDFARQLIRTKSFTEDESELADLVMNKMKELDYDHVSVDEFGNIIGVVGDGHTRMLFDSHMDTVGVNHPEKWHHDPFGGEIVEGKLYGRGSVDMKSALAASVYAGHMIKRLGLQKGKTIYVTASVMEEDYDGETVYAMCRQMNHLPDYAVICEPSDLNLALGHKGRTLLRVVSTGIAAHGSAPEKGVNAVYRISPLLERVEALNNKMQKQSGEAGSIALTKISSSAESLNAIPDRCELFIDRRLVAGEDKTIIAEEMNGLLEGTGASWEVYDKHGQSYTGEPVVLHSFLPSWEISPDSHLAEACIRTFETLFERKPRLVKWDFCTNGVATAGRLNIPTIGIGPGDSKRAHTVDEYCETSQITAAAQFYTLLPNYL